MVVEAAVLLLVVLWLLVETVALEVVEFQHHGLAVLV
jgi:hypothetical protein